MVFQRKEISRLLLAVWSGVALAFVLSPLLQAQSVLPVSVDTLLRTSRIRPSSTTGVSIDWNALPHVGMAAFARAGETRENPGALPLPPDYRLGPGDRLGVYLLGKTQREYDVTLNAQGKAYLPGLGVVDLMGCTLDSAKERLQHMLARYFAEKRLEVLLLSPKAVMVSVVGVVQRPGRYALSGLQTAFDAVFAAGGPEEGGSLRCIQVRHPDGTSDSVDLYNLLLLGEGRGGPPLRSGDVVHVPPVRASVALAGEVRRPGVYELRGPGQESLADLLRLAGGLTKVAYAERVEVSRQQGDGWRRVQYVDVRDSVAAARVQLEDRDRVRVYSVLDLRERPTVEIYGEVRKPGVYTLEKGMRIRDLILKAGGVTRMAFLEKAELDRVQPKSPVKRLKFDLAAVLSGESADQNLELREYDRVLIRRIPEWYVGPSVTLRGEVMFPGRYTITKDSTKLSEVLRWAGGFTKDALLREAQLIRPSTRVKFDKEYERLKQMRRDEMTDLEYQYFVMKQNQGVGRVVVDFYRLWVLGDTTQDVVLRDGDIIDVPRIERVVEVTGRVARPGDVTYEPGHGVDYYLQRAGGVTWDGNRRKTKVIKATGEILDDEDVKELLPGDIIWVPRKPDRDWWKIARELMTALAQAATVYLVVDRALNR